jgi:hypothetical protein
MSRRLTPSQVLDLQGLFEAQLHRDSVRQYIMYFAESIEDQTDGHRLPHFGEDVANHMQTLTRGAHTFHVQSEMTDLIQAAALGLDDNAPWRRELLPTEVGFVYFDRPLLLVDVRGRILKAHAILWGPARTTTGVAATAVYWLNDMEDPDDMIKVKAEEFGYDVDDLRRDYGRLQPFHIDFLSDDKESLGPPQLEPSDHYAVQIAAEGDTPTPADNGTRLFVAYLRLLSQTLIKSSPASVDKAAKKRATRRGLPGLVTTVTLRRVTYVGNETHDETEVEWSHRWLVRGHWRRQPCGPEHPLAEPDGHGGFVAIIYINPYIKGPEDKPLHLSNKVYDLAR